MKINVLTLFPQLFSEHLNNLPFKRAIEDGSLEVKLWNLRDYALDSYGTVDGRPYGGGTGMILMVEPIYNALKDIYGINDKTAFSRENKNIVLLSPKGRKFQQKDAVEYSKKNEVTFICGRYEGVDARVAQDLATDVISIGDYVLSGGELPALVVMETLTRLIPGVLEEEATSQESFSQEDEIEYPQYTRPENFKDMKVPGVLLSGNHAKIEKWKKKNKGCETS